MLWEPSPGICRVRWREGGSPALPAICFPSTPQGSGCKIIEFHRLFLRAPLCYRHKLERRQCLKFMFWLSVTSYIAVLGCPQLASVLPFCVEIFQPRSVHKGHLKESLFEHALAISEYDGREKQYLHNKHTHFSFKDTKQSSNF